MASGTVCNLDMTDPVEMVLQDRGRVFVFAARMVDVELEIGVGVADLRQQIEDLCAGIQSKAGHIEMIDRFNHQPDA